MNLKIAVYTAIFGNKDKIKSPINLSKINQIDYFIITDNKENQSGIYEVIYREDIYSDITKNARYYKIFGIAAFEKYDYVIWHDANLQILHDKIPDLIDALKNKSMATFSHPIRTCFYDEAIACIQDKKEEPLTLFKQVFRYFRKRVPINSGLYETSILVRNNRIKNLEFNELWWKEIKKFSRRDQIALSYALYKYPVSINILKGERLNNPYSLYFEHFHNYYFHKSKNNLNKIFKQEKIIQWIKALKKVRGENFKKTLWL